MARTVLIIATAVWILAGLGGLGIAALGTEAVAAALPPLAIDRSALGGAITAVSFGAIGVAILHAAAVVGIRRRWRLALAAGALLAAVMAVVFAASAAAAVASLIREPDYLASLGAAALGTSVAAVAYAAVTVRLIGDLRPESGS